MIRSIYQFLTILSILSFLMVGATAPTNAIPWKDKVDPWILQTASQGDTEFLVYLTSQADLSAAKALATKLEKGRYVFATLTALAERTQKPVIAELKRLGMDYRPYWIANMIWVRGSMSSIQLLAERADVLHLYANPKVALSAPLKQDAVASQPTEVEWNINRVNAPQVWALGYTGQGVVIGGQDTGYDWTHPALIGKYRGWNGISASHDYNWHDAIHDGPSNPCGYDSLVPCDDFGHGTHTMGTMVGDDGDVNQIGMAPGARWIGCRNMDSGWGKPSTYAECYEWFVAPYPVGGTPAQGDPSKAPDVIDNSWSCPPEEGCTDPNVLLTVVQNLVAAGIVTVHSAGNDSSACSTVQDPAAIYAESFTVGATNLQNEITNFSSRGPVTVDGSNRLKPDISAPGSSIRSSIPGNAYAIYSGTSMAAPHVAGLVALLISAYPALHGHVDQIETTIEHSALHIDWTGCSSSGVPNNAYGWGLIDALSAVENAHLISLHKDSSAVWVNPGNNITYTLSITHTVGITPVKDVMLTDLLPADTTFITATVPFIRIGDAVRWDFASIEPMGTRSVELVVKVNQNASNDIINSDYAVQGDQVAYFHGLSVTTLIVKMFFLPLLMKSP